MPLPHSEYDTPEQIAKNFRRWAEAMEISHAMLIAGLRDRVGGDIREAYRQWQENRRSQKLKAYEQAALHFRQRQKGTDVGEVLNAP